MPRNSIVRMNRVNKPRQSTPRPAATPRFVDPFLPPKVKVTGSLSESEIEAMRSAYASGAMGQILIGLAQEKRILQMLIPAKATVEAGNMALKENLEQLARFGADGFIHVRRVRVHSKDKLSVSAMLIHEKLQQKQSQLVVPLDLTYRRTRLRRRVRDGGT